MLAFRLGFMLRGLGFHCWCRWELLLLTCLNCALICAFNSSYFGGGLVCVGCAWTCGTPLVWWCLPPLYFDCGVLDSGLHFLGRLLGFGFFRCYASYFRIAGWTCWILI